MDFSAKCMLGRHGLWFLFRKILCQKLNKLDGKNLIFIFFFVYFAAVCLLPSEFLLQKNFFDMVPGFDQTQVEKMQFHIGFHNIYSKYKPRNREYTNNIFKNFFLSPSWRHGPKNSFFSFAAKTNISNSTLSSLLFSSFYKNLMRELPRRSAMYPSI